MILAKDMATQQFVLLIDMMDSSRLKDRQALSVSLGEALIELNRQFAADLYAPFEITRGDEVAAVLTSAQSLYRMCRLFNDFLHPLKYRLVLCFGELTAGLDTHRSTIIDGPAFYQARKMMLQLKRTRRFVALSTRAEHVDPVLQSMMNMLSWQWGGFTALQQQVVSLYLLHRNQATVANQLGRSQQQIQSSLKSCGWEIIEEAERQTKHLLALLQRAHRQI